MWKKPNTCRGCLNEHRAAGFCPDEIVPGARLAVFAQAPSRVEIQTDSPLTGPAGYVLSSRVLRHSGLMGEMLSKANVLRCMQPDNKYPTGRTRRESEQLCRQYDQIKPSDFDVTLVSLHPADMLYTKYDPLVLLVNDFTRAKKFLDAGKTVSILLGTEAKQLYAPWLVGKDAVGKKHSGVNDWRGHYWYNGATTFGLLLHQQECDKYTFVSKLKGEGVALDLEWNPDGLITLAGFATDDYYTVLSNPSPEELNTIIQKASLIIGHNLLGQYSDIYHLSLIGVNVPLEKVRDTHLMLHLLFPQLAGLGYLDLWTLCSLYTDYPNWKLCRGDGHCFGPCPLHNPALYNAFDVCADYDAYKQMALELGLRGQI